MAPPEPVPVGWDKVQPPEVGVLKVDQRERIRRAYFIEGKSIRQIALEGHHHRRTVRQALRDASPARYTRRQPRARPILGPFVHLIDQWLAEDLTRPAKQRHTAHRIYQRLVEGHGFTGKESNLRQYVREHLPTPRHSGIFIPLTYEPGEDAQCDFGEAQVVLAGRQVKVQLFCLRLCYSKLSFVMALPHQQQEAFFEGHQQAFDFFGGVPRHVWYDNLSQAVRPRLLGRRPQEQDSFVAFRSHYLFESRFCTPAEAHEKGLVEGLVGYARRNLLVPLPEVDSFQELNDLLRQRCLAEASRRLRGENQTRESDHWRAVGAGAASPAALAPPAVLLLSHGAGPAQPVEPGHLPDQPVQRAGGVGPPLLVLTRLCRPGGDQQRREGSGGP